MWSTSPAGRRPWHAGRVNEVLHREGDLTVIRRDAPDARWLALLSGVSWGTDGLRYRLNEVGHALDRWYGAQFLELARGDELLAVFVLVPHRYVVEGLPITTWYRSMLAAAPGLAGGGLGRVLTSAARRIYLDEATVPTLLYGYIESDNSRSMRLQERLGYQPLFELEAASWGWLRPAITDGVERCTDRVAFLAAMRRFWKGHQLDDLDQSAPIDDLWVLRRGGKVVAGALVVDKSLGIEHLPGLDGKLLMAGSPVLRHLTPFFRTDPHTVLWTGPVFFEGDDPEPLLALLQALQGATGASSGLWYVDPRSPARARLQALGPIHRLSPSPTLRAMAGWKNVPDTVIEAIRRGPVLASSLDSA